MFRIAAPATSFRYSLVQRTLLLFTTAEPDERFDKAPVLAVRNELVCLKLGTPKR
jgi:hypothetical protein